MNVNIAIKLRVDKAAGWTATSSQMNTDSQVALIYVQAALHRNEDAAHIVAAWRRFRESLEPVPNWEMLTDVPDSDYEALAWIRLKCNNTQTDKEHLVFYMASYADSRIHADRSNGLVKLIACITCHKE